MALYVTWIISCLSIDAGASNLLPARVYPAQRRISSAIQADAHPSRYKIVLKHLTNFQCRASYSARFLVSLTTMSQEQPIPRPLLPKPPTLPFQARLQASNLDPRLQEQPSDSTPQAKRTQVRVACGACQKKKVKSSQPLATAFR